MRRFTELQRGLGFYVTAASGPIVLGALLRAAAIEQATEEVADAAVAAALTEDVADVEGLAAAAESACAG